MLQECLQELGQKFESQNLLLVVCQRDLSMLLHEIVASLVVIATCGKNFYGSRMNEVEVAKINQSTILPIQQCPRSYVKMVRQNGSSQRSAYETEYSLTSIAYHLSLSLTTRLRVPFTLG